MANAIITPTIIAKEALMQLENAHVMPKLVHRDYRREFRKVGDSVRVRKPVKFNVTDGAIRQQQDVQEAYTSITVDKRKHVSWAFSTGDLTLSIEDYSERYIKPAAIALGQQIESDLCGLYADVWNWVGTAGSAPANFAALAAAARRLDDGAVPSDQRRCILNPEAHYAVAATQTGLFVNAANRMALEEAKLGKIANLDTYMGQSVKVHTTGTFGGSPAVNGPNQATTYAVAKNTWTQTLNTNGWSSGATTLRRGDVITIADVYAVNPRTYESTGELQNFVVVETISDWAGAIALTISPPIITSGPYQTVDSVPGDTKAISVKTGTTGQQNPQNLVFHKNAFALVAVDLEMPDSVGFKARESNNSMSIRVVKDYDIDNDEEVIRLDILYGVKAIYPELACRLTG